MYGKEHEYTLTMVLDIMFVETKNTNYRSTDKGVVFNDKRAFYVGGLINFGKEEYEITTVPEAQSMGSNNSTKVTFSVKRTQK